VGYSDDKFYIMPTSMLLDLAEHLEHNRGILSTEHTVREWLYKNFEADND